MPKIAKDNQLNRERIKKQHPILQPEMQLKVKDKGQGRRRRREKPSP